LIDEMDSPSAFPFAFSAKFHYLCCAKQLGGVAQSAGKMADFAACFSAKLNTAG